MHLVKFLKKVNFLSICIIMAFCFLLLLNSFVFGAVTLFHVQLFLSCAMIVTSVVVSIFYHSWCSVLCLNEAILNAFNDCGQFEKDASVLASFAAVFRLVPPHKRLLNRAIHSFPGFSQSHFTYYIPVG